MQEDRRVHADANALRYNRLPAVRAGNPLDIDHAIADDDAGACACTSSSNRTSFMLVSPSRGEGVPDEAGFTVLRLGGDSTQIIHSPTIFIGKIRFYINKEFCKSETPRSRVSLAITRARS